MATIGNAHTLSDLQKMLNPDGSIARVMEVLNESNPMMEDIRWEEGDLPIGTKTVIRTSLPTPSIRRINRGTAPTKGSVRSIIDVCMHLEDRSKIDVELLSGKPNPEAYRMAEDDAHVEGIAQYVARQFLYGDLEKDPDVFNGFMPRYNTLKDLGKGSAGHQVISAGTANSNGKNGSIWFVDWGDNRVVGIYPKGTMAGLKKQDLGESDVLDADGNAYRAVQTLYSYKCGLAVKNLRSVVRVCNIDMATIDSLTDAQAKKLVDRFVYAKNRLWLPKNPVAYVSGDLYSWFECYLTNKNNIHVTRDQVTNGAAPILRFNGIQLKKMDCMEDTEAAVTE